MGGHGAIYLMLRNPDFFTGAGSTSGILDLTKFPDKWGLVNLLGSISSNAGDWFSYSCLYLLKNIEWSYKPIIIDCGTEDFALEINQRFVDLCKVYGIKADYFFGQGNHSKDYWKKSIVNHFKFFKALSLKN
jgi:S-formylglutathione hydrolase FrmB